MKFRSNVQVTYESTSSTAAAVVPTIVFYSGGYGYRGWCHPAETGSCRFTQRQAVQGKSSEYVERTQRVSSVDLIEGARQSQ